MSKLVVLELDGDFEQQGFRATLEIGADGDRSVKHHSLQQQTIKIKGNLPANPQLAARQFLSGNMCKTHSPNYLMLN